MVLWKLTFRAMVHRPLRALLTLISIVIGVGAVVAVMLSSQSTRRAQEALFETVTGRAGLEATAEDGGSFPETLVASLEDAPGIKAAVPVLQRTSLLSFENSQPAPSAQAAPQQGPKKDALKQAGEEPTSTAKEANILVLGIDPARHGEVHDHDLAEGQELGEEDGVLLDVSLARFHGIKVGDQVQYAAGKSGFKSATVLGLYKPRGAAAANLSSVMFMPLPMAQRAFRAKGQVDRVLLVLKEGMSDEEAIAAVSPRLPEGVTVHRPPSRSQVADANAMAIQLGLDMAFVFALLVAVFVILNTFLMNVGERAKQLAILRAVGGTRRQITWLLLREAAMTGVLGGALGAAAGLYGATFLKQGMERFFQTAMPEIEITPQPFLLAAGLGLVVSLVGALVPAIRAGRLTPLEGMKGVERSMEGVSIWAPLAGILLIVYAAAGVYAGYKGMVPTIVSIIAANKGLIGVVLLFPLVLRPMSRVAVAVLRPVLRLEARLAQRQILRHHARTMLTMGVMFVAISTCISLATAVLDNVHNVQGWYRKTIIADFFIWTMMPTIENFETTQVPETLGPQIRQVEGVTGIETLRWFGGVKVEGQRVVLAVREFPSDDFANFDTPRENSAELRQRLLAGDVVIGSVLAQRLGKSAEDELTFTTQSGPKSVRIAAIANEYRAGGLLVYMQRDVAKDLMGIDGIDEYLIKADHGRRAEVEAALAALCQKNGVSLHSKADIVDMIDGMVNGLVVGLWGMMVLGFVVSALGVVNTLTMNVLEQTRELGLLRVVGMTRWQIRKMILSQGLLLGGLALVPGLLSGLGVAYVINIATLPVTGHAVEMGTYPGLWAGVLVLAILTAALAAILPAERAARLAPSSCLQYE